MANLNKHLDPRIRRTREGLRKAFIELVLENGCPFITVTDLAERAFINRSTFYLHYHDIEDLMTTGFSEYWDQVLPGLEMFIYHKPVLLPDRIQAVIATDMNHFEMLRPFYRLMLCHYEVISFHRSLSDHFLKITSLRFSAPCSLGKTQTIDPEMVHHWTASAYLGLILEWLSEDHPQSTSSLGMQISQLLLHTYQGILAIPSGSGENWTRSERPYSIRRVGV